MDNSYYGKLDFTKLCRLWRGHKELFEMVNFQDGPHALLKCNFNARQQPDDHGNTHYLQANCKKADQREGLNYYIGDSFKPSQNNAQQPQAAPQKVSEDPNDLPF